ncbi:Alpha/Beta hydrolase protein [Phycomyces nitens]|nr:Alpha/Beta hydrolase protein [Phycomyces nitens]
MVNPLPVVHHYIPNDPLGEIDVYNPNDVNPAMPLMVFVHGGAWVSEDKSDHVDLGLAWTKLGMVVAIPNYKLSPREYTRESIVHPAHCNDIAKAIKYLAETVAKDRPIYISGHSAGAHIITTLLLDPVYSIAPLVKGAVGIDGIYDIPLLLRTFPSYISFIKAAFGDDDKKYLEYSPVSKTPVLCRLPPVIIVHSMGDKLVDYPQAQAMFEHLKPLTKVTIDTSVSGDHYAMLNTPELANLIGAFVNSRE